LTQDIGRGLSKTKRNIIEGEIKMYVIAHHLFKSNKFLRECPWTENFPVDQLVDEDNTILKFETKEEAINTLKSWGVDMSIALEQGVKIESVN
jgi:hypothetical protein